ncbi:MAG: hypothetical protein HY804_07255 [Nitrospinae bacterium]|nr:hypothetical protein [Nitrospinota bacterium]
MKNALSDRHSLHPNGAVHGRFQPLHNEHTKYIMGALERCRTLWIGLARHNIRDSISCASAKHREEKISNPLSFIERYLIIEAVLLSEGIHHDRFRIVPFPIDEPDLMIDYIPVDTVCFTTIVDDWNRLKIDSLRKHGFNVESLWENLSHVCSGKRIREYILKDDLIWQTLVHPEAAKMIVQYNLRQRLIDLSKDGNVL